MEDQLTEQIFIKLSNKTITIDILPNMTVLNLKNLIYKKTKIHNDFYYLVYGIKLLDLKKYLSYYDINKEATIHLHMRSSLPKYNCLSHIMNFVDSEKRVKAEKGAIIHQKPCIVQMKYYVITPSGTHLYGTSDYIKKRLNQELYSLEDLHAIEDDIYSD